MGKPLFGTIAMVTEGHDGKISFHIATPDNRGYDAEQREIAPIYLERIKKYRAHSVLGMHVRFVPRTKTIRRRRKSTEKMVVATYVGVDPRYFGIKHKPETSQDSVE